VLFGSRKIEADNFHFKRYDIPAAPALGCRLRESGLGVDGEVGSFPLGT
jgi:hypothetical protein